MCATPLHPGITAAPPAAPPQPCISVAITTSVIAPAAPPQPPMTVAFAPPQPRVTAVTPPGAPPQPCITVAVAPPQPRVTAATPPAAPPQPCIVARCAAAATGPTSHAQKYGGHALICFPRTLLSVRSLFGLPTNTVCLQFGYHLPDRTGLPSAICPNGLHTV